MLPEKVPNPTVTLLTVISGVPDNPPAVPDALPVTLPVNEPTNPALAVQAPETLIPPAPVIPDPTGS